MTFPKRLDALLKLIEEKDYCTVDFLAKSFNVSHMTIRRDLNTLFSQNKILRCRGGAGAIKFNETVTPSFFIREQHGVEKKRIIASKAVTVLNSGSVIFIDHSSTAIPFLKYITPESGITVVTNGLKAFTELSEKKVNVYFTGGEFHSLEQAYFGENAVKVIEMMHFDAAFVSPRGIVPHEGAFDSSEHEANIIKAAMKNSDNSYALFSLNKLGDRFGYKLCDLHEFTEIFTDTDHNLSTLI